MNLILHVQEYAYLDVPAQMEVYYIIMYVSMKVSVLVSAYCDCRKLSTIQIKLPTFQLLADCGDLDDIDNGEVSFNATTEGSTATYSCDAGYELNGDTTRTCLADGTWSGTEPQCQGTYRNSCHH